MKFHHIGYATLDIENEKKHLAGLGYKFGASFVDSNQMVKGQFLHHGALTIELLEPSDPESPIMSYINRGIKMYHQAFLCGSLVDSINDLVKLGAVKLGESKQAVAFGGRQICFLMLRNGLLIELIEDEK